LGKLLKLSDLERIEPKIRLLRKTQQVSILNWQKNSSPIISSIVIRYFTPFLFRYSITIGLELESFLRDTRISIKLKSFLTSFWNKIRILRHLRKISIVTDSKKVWDERNFWRVLFFTFNAWNTWMWIYRFKKRGKDSALIVLIREI